MEKLNRDLKAVSKTLSNLRKKNNMIKAIQQGSDYFFLANAVIAAFLLKPQFDISWHEIH